MHVMPRISWLNWVRLALIPAGGFTLAACNNDFSWYFVAPAALLWGVGIWYLKRGSDRWNEDPH